MTHVIVHAGFHKTGTTSMQNFLSQNRAALSPFFDYYGQQDFLNAGAAARLYAQRPFPHRLHRFRKAFRRFLTSIPDHKLIVLSRESFSGGMPGHRKLGGRMITSYHQAALKLARVIIAELRRRFGREVEITFFYTTRNREDWIKSVHGHLLRSINLTDDLDAFAARFPALIGPTQEAQRMSGALSPVPVVTAALEDFASTAHGTAEAILDMAGVPGQVRDRLDPAPHSNQGQPDHLRDAFLDLNRMTLSKPERKARKNQLLSRRQTHR